MSIHMSKHMSKYMSTRMSEYMCILCNGGSGPSVGARLRTVRNAWVRATGVRAHAGNDMRCVLARARVHAYARKNACVRACVSDEVASAWTRPGRENACVLWSVRACVRACAQDYVGAVSGAGMRACLYLRARSAYRLYSHGLPSYGL